MLLFLPQLIISTISQSHREKHRRSIDSGRMSFLIPQPCRNKAKKSLQRAWSEDNAENLPHFPVEISHGGRCIGPGQCTTGV